MKKKNFRFFLFLFLTFIFLYLIFSANHVEVPSPKRPVVLYSNQTKQDLKLLIVKAIKSAKKSIYLVSFGLSDPAVLEALVAKNKEKIDIVAYYDIRSSPNIQKAFPQIAFYPTKDTGLLHQKILIIDHKIIFLGSANMTKSSLKMHHNLIAGLFSPKLSRFIEKKTPFKPGYCSGWISGQHLEFWLLPDAKHGAIEGLKKEIRKAKKEIRLAMFTLTHPILIGELIAAKERGVDVEVAIDYYSAKGASRKGVEQLKKYNIPIKLSKGFELFHHKFLYIDQSTLSMGSANWTKAAFKKNRDCFFTLHQLKKEEKRFMNRLWKTIHLEKKKENSLP